MNYSINIKTNYEILSSTVDSKTLVNFAKQNNVSYLGITDTYLFNAIEFYNNCVNNNIKPIIGSEFIYNGYSIYLYAKNFIGYQKLCKYVTNKDEFNSELDFDNLVIVCDYDLYELFKNNKYVFIGYKNDLEKSKCLLVSKNIVYNEKVLCINGQDTEYLNYLYKIKDKKDNEYNFSNNYLKSISNSDKELLDAFANLIDLKFPTFTFDIPVYCENDKEYLKSLVYKGINKRLNNNVPDEYINRIEHELDLIDSMGYTSYILIVYDYVLFAKKEKILVGPGRGSAVGSLVAYSIGITDIDPVKYNLMFERFLNKYRKTMPDVDVDFDSENINKVIQYVTSKYENSFLSNIITFDNLTFKVLAKLISTQLNISEYKFKRFKENIDNIDELKKLCAYDADLKKVLDVSLKLQNTKSKISVHVAGIILSSTNIVDRVALYKYDSKILTTVSKEYLEQMGLLKMDFLSLDNLTLINKMFLALNKEYNKYFNFNNIYLNDEKTFKMFNEKCTSNIFQFKSKGMTDFIEKYKINNFNDIVNATSLYRPASQEILEEIINRKNNNKKYTCDYKCLEETYGLIVYQEQIMVLLNEVASYDLGTADIIRRKLSKSDKEYVKKEKEKFLDEGIKNGYDVHKLNELFDNIVKFSGYSFNKSHAVAYALISYTMMFIKANFPLVFYELCLNTKLNTQEEYELINEAKHLKITFTKADINTSKKNYYVLDNNIVIPFSSIKTLNSKIVDEIVGVVSNSRITDYIDAVVKLYKNNIDYKSFITIIQSGLLDNTGVNRKSMVMNLNKVINYAQLCDKLGIDDIEKPVIETYEEYSQNELFEMEKLNYGFYISTHPASIYYKKDYIKINDINRNFNRNVKLVGYIESIKTIITKKGKNMAFINISDESGETEGIIFDTSNFDEIQTNSIYLFETKISKRFDSYQLIINNLYKCM